MAKKTTKTKQRAEKKDKRNNKGWNQKFTFVKLPKIEPPKESVYGAVLAALRKVKSGTVAEIADEAGKQGLHKLTKQNPRIQTQIKLRRLVRLGSAKKEKLEKPEKEAKAKKAKAAPEKKDKAPAAKKVAKKAAPKKAAPPAKKKAAPKKVKAKKEVEIVSDEELEEIDSSIDEGEGEDSEE
jgi:hypothetical protein